MIPKLELRYYCVQVLQEYKHTGRAREYGFQKQEVVIEEDQLIKNARRGDLIRVVMSVDPGTQHGLRVRAFQMTLIHKKALALPRIRPPVCPPPKPISPKNPATRHLCLII